MQLHHYQLRHFQTNTPLICNQLDLYWLSTSLRTSAELHKDTHLSGNPIHNVSKYSIKSIQIDSHYLFKNVQSTLLPTDLQILQLSSKQISQPNSTWSWSRNHLEDHKGPKGPKHQSISRATSMQKHISWRQPVAPLPQLTECEAWQRCWILPKNYHYLIRISDKVQCRKQSMLGSKQEFLSRLESEISSTQLDACIKWHNQYNQGTEKRALDVAHGCQKGTQSANAQDPLEVKMYQNDLGALLGCSWGNWPPLHAAKKYDCRLQMCNDAQITLQWPCNTLRPSKQSPQNITVWTVDCWLLSARPSAIKTRFGTRNLVTASSLSVSTGALIACSKRYNQQMDLPETAVKLPVAASVCPFRHPCWWRYLSAATSWTAHQGDYG